MPWRQMAMKDVVICDKLRGADNRLRSGDFRIGKPGTGHTVPLPPEHIGWAEPTGGTETSKYPEEKKVITIPQVAASERGGAQTGLMSSLQAL